VSYVLANLNGPVLSALQNELMNWATANSPSLTALLSSIGTATRSSTDRDWLALFSAVVHSLRPEVLNTHKIGDNYLEELADVVSYLTSTVADGREAQTAPKDKVALLKWQVICALDAVTSMEPSLLLRPAAPRALRIGTEHSQKLSPAANGALQRILHRTANLLDLLMSTAIRTRWRPPSSSLLTSCPLYLNR